MSAATLSVVTSRISLDISRMDIQNNIPVTQGDTKRRIEVTLMNAGQPLAVNEDWTVMLVGIKPDGAKINNLCDVENGKIVYDFATGDQIATAAGAFYIQFNIFDEVGELLGTPKIWLSVVANAIKEMESEDQLLALQEVIKIANENEEARTAVVLNAIERSEEVNQNHETAEAARAAAEQTRAENEFSRVTAELTRANAEAARATAEQERAASEVTRAAAEELRANAEAARATAEQKRAAAEATRVANEEAREDLRAELEELKAMLERLVDELPGDVDRLPELIDRVNAILDSDDETLDELSEIVAYIKNNKTLIESITTSKVSVGDIIDRLDSTLTNKPLSANQGRVLYGMAESAQTTADSALTAAGNAATAASNAAAAAQNAQNTANGKEAAGTAATMLNRTTAVNAADTNYATLMARGTSLNAAETTPTVNGTIAWNYK